MKLTIDTSMFTEAVTWVTKNYDANNSDSYVGLVINDEGQGFLSHLSDTAYRKAPLTAATVDFGDEKGIAIALDGKYLQRLSSALGKTTGELNLTVSGDDIRSLNIRSTFGDFTVPVYLKRISKVPEVVTLGEFSEVEFLDGMQRISKLSDNDTASNAPVITAIDLRLNPEDGSATIMGTDRFALGEITFEYTPADTTDEIAEIVTTDGENPRSFMIPASIAATVAPAKGSTESLELVYDAQNQKIGYLFADGRMALFSMLVGESITPLKYPAILEAAQKGIDQHLVVSMSDLKKAVAAVSSLAWDEKYIWLKIDTEQQILTTSDDHAKNTIDLSLNALEAKKNIDVKFNRITMNKALNSITSSHVKVNWGESGNNVSFTLQPVISEGQVDDSMVVLVQPQKQ